MPNYTYRCTGCAYVEDLVRPIGTDVVQCPFCFKPATRSQVHHIEVRGPTVNTAHMASLALENLDERQDAFARYTRETGEAIPQPNDWAGVTAEARELVRRGEVDTKAILKETDGEVFRGGRARASVDKD